MENIEKIMKNNFKIRMYDLINHFLNIEMKKENKQKIEKISFIVLWMQSNNLVIVTEYIFGLVLISLVFNTTFLIIY